MTELEERCQHYLVGLWLHHKGDWDKINSDLSEGTVYSVDAFIKASQEFQQPSPTFKRIYTLNIKGYPKWLLTATEHAPFVIVQMSGDLDLNEIPGQSVLIQVDDGDVAKEVRSFQNMLYTVNTVMADDGKIIYIFRKQDGEGHVEECVCYFSQVEDWVPLVHLGGVAVIKHDASPLAQVAELRLKQPGIKTLAIAGNPGSETNRLIKKGVGLCDCPEDIFLALLDYRKIDALK